MAKNYPVLKNIVSILFLLFSVTAFSQTNGDFRSKGPGPSDWEVPGSWQIYNGSAWINATTYPGQNAGTYTVTIQTGHTISILTNLVTASMGSVIVNGNLNLVAPNSNLFIVTLNSISLTISGTNSILNFDGVKIRLVLDKSSFVEILDGGNIVGDCNHNDEIFIGLQKYAVCKGTGNEDIFTFSDIVSAGGTINAIITSPIGNPTTICNSQIVTLVGKYSGAVNTSNPVSYEWVVKDPNNDIVSIPNNTGNLASTFANTIGTSFTPTLTGDYLVTFQVKTILGSASFTNIETKTVTVNPLPAAPTLGTITQPTCATSTGSVVLNGLPATGTWTINPGAITGNTTSKTISGLAAGTFNFTVTNSNGCTSTPSSNVVINPQPANNVWTGSVSTDWNTDANWSCGTVPTISTDVLIPTIPTGGKYPILTTFIDPTYPEGYAKNIVFESGTTLIIENNALNVSGNLTLNGNIDLNNESQLVQGAVSTFDPASIGTIEIDQQGTSDNFKYNYWGSPVNVTGTTYTIAGVLRDGTVPTVINELNLIDFGAPYIFADGAAPLAGEAIKLSTYWMYKYANLGNGYSGWTRAGKDGNLNAGEGFTMKGSNTNLPEQNYTFVGIPNNGDINLTISANNDYLIGNPYPSALDAKEFIRDNIAAPSGSRTVNVIDGNLYFWDHFGGGNHLLKSYEGGYGIVNLTGEIKAMATDALINNTGNQSIKIPPRFIPVAQGFFVTAVSGIVGTENIQFKNSQRLFKKEEP
ncbi:MAG: hypothetical protein P1P79_06750, partial [Lutibacter sp.]|nr:hypothetical protein [Lutibacter sp.]